jgi:hypothetical protein
VRIGSLTLVFFMLLVFCVSVSIKKGKKKKEKTGKGPTVLFLHADPDSTEACAPILFFRSLGRDLPCPLAPNWDTPPTIVPPCWIAKLKKECYQNKKKKRIAKTRERQQ